MRRPPCLRFVAATSLVAVVLAAVPLPFRGLLADAVQDGIHVAGFAVFGLLLVRCATTRRVVDEAHRRRRFAIAVGVLLALAIGTEGLQFFTPRDSDPGDFARNLVAVGVGVSLGGWFLTASPRRRGALTALAVGGTVLATVPIASAVDAALARAGSLPVIHEFDEAWEMRFVSRRATDAHRVRLDGRTALDVTYRSGRWPSVIFREVPPDWSGFDVLVLDVENREPETVRVGVRVDDRFDAHDFADRFQRGFDLRPGRQTLRIPLEEMVAGVTTRDFDLKRMRSVAVFAVSEFPRPMRIRIDAIRLERADPSTGLESGA